MIITCGFKCQILILYHFMKSLKVSKSGNPVVACLVCSMYDRDHCKCVLNDIHIN